jgi:CPA2 family monovalent cation:H+ antiporter-2
MPFQSDLIFTLVTAFVAAFAGGMIASRLGLPPIVGYLLAGIAIGPHTPGGSASPELATQLAEVGVILLMFGVGLHFSSRQLLAVGRIAVPGALGQITAATALGVLMTQLWGWSLEEGLMLGLCLSVASTVVLLRALEDRNMLDTRVGHVAVGWLIVEDLFTVVVLVLLPVIAESETENIGLASLLPETSPIIQVLISLAQASLFVVLMMLVGSKLIPLLLREVVRAGSRELFTLAILAIALGVAFGSAEFFGASLALGAFLAGIVLNESELSHRAGLEALPLRDAFAVLFFVSVGMVFEPSILTEEPLEVITVVLIVVAGKSIAAFAIVAGMGYGMRTGLTVSASLAQVGEFSFILAGLATQLDVFPEDATSLVLAASLISITLNPFFFTAMEALEPRLSRFTGLVRIAERHRPVEEEEPSFALRRHAVICGHGATGSSLARGLAGRGLPFVVVENDPYIFERMRAAGVPAVFGDASRPDVLEQAGIADARLCALTFSSPSDQLRTAQVARTLNPRIDIVARSSGDSLTMLRRAGASEVVDPEFEASLEFVRHVLHRFGVDGREITALQTRWRSEYYRVDQ